MTPTEVITILRQYREWLCDTPKSVRPHTRQINEAIDAAVEMIDRLEAAEKDIALKERVIDSLGLALNAAAHERDNLRAKVAEMEKQEPVGTLHDDGYFVWSAPRPYESNYAGWKMKLYTLPGAQPAPSIPEGWLRAIDEALIVAHIGVANPSDTYEQAKAKLDNLIGFHVDVATDPAVNGGWKLVPIEVIYLYSFMCAAFVPMTPQQEEIALQLDLAKRAVLAAPETKS